MKENDNIQFPQRGRPKKTGFGSSYSYSKMFDSDKTYKPQNTNDIFENQYELDECEQFTTPFEEMHSFNGSALNVTAMSDTPVYEQGYENINNGYIYDKKPYEEQVDPQGYVHPNEYYKMHGGNMQNIDEPHMQMNYDTEAQQRYYDIKQQECPDPYYNDNKPDFRSPPGMNYGTIEEFDDAKFYNLKRKDQKNIYSYADHFMNAGWMNRKKRKNNPFVWQYLKNQESPQLIPSSEYSSVNYVNSLDNTRQKIYIGSMKRPSYIEKSVSNNTILPLFLNSSSHYESNTSKQEFDKIANAFMKKTECLDYENVTVQQLKMMMKEFGLSHTGKKQELIERMKQTASMIRDKIRNKGCGEIENRPAKKKDYVVKPSPGMDNETEGFDYLFF